MDKATAHREWLVRAELIDQTPGFGTVEITLTNGIMGRLPPFNMVVDWKPGMEPNDVEIFAIGLVADSAKALSEALIAEAAARMADGG